MHESVKQRRALIVDDERTIVEVLSNYLKDEGYAVTGAFDGADGLKKALAEPFDVILLDLNLPTISGVEIFKQIRKVSDVPILMVTSRDDSIDRIVGLELGADDYISKPFNPREVVARVKNIVHRTERKPSVTRIEHDVERVGDLEIDRTGHEVRVGGKSLKLTPMEYRILDVFVRNSGVALTRSQLLDNISADSTEIYDRTLDKHIANLRSKIGDDPSRPRYIITVQGVGYKFAQ
ncbi:MAG TPA: response regulator transcription factor [Candidatus Acidoferrales bacterium]|nr:response regulator transcription factor [Candidatus Acidoferrales bacterium]